jgi:hypothetical protein
MEKPHYKLSAIFGMIVLVTFCYRHRVDGLWRLLRLHHRLHAAFQFRVGNWARGVAVMVGTDDYIKVAAHPRP